jgi:hypothetical protein
MLFNLSCCRIFPNKRNGNEIEASRYAGPVFGDCELLVVDEPFNADRNCGSNVNGKKFGIPEEGGKNMLTNLKDRGFTITELEVWEVTEIEQ